MIKGGKSEDMTFFVIWIILLATIASFLFGKKISDVTYGFHGIKKSLVEELDLKSENFDIETEIILKVLKKGIKYKEIPSFEKKRLFGHCKLNSFSDGRDIFLKILIERFTK